MCNKDQDVAPQEGYTDVVTAVRYNNNSIHELGDLVPSITSLVVNPQAISWLDFSFNDINQLDDSDISNDVEAFDARAVFKQR